MQLHRKLAALTALATALSPAWAVSPHFVSATGTVAVDGSLIINFKEAGLGDNQRIDYTMTTTASATYACYNKGSNQVNGQPYRVPDQAASASGSLYSGRNGSITGSFDVDPPSPQLADQVLKCTETGKTLCLSSVSYSDTTLTDTTNNLSTGVTPNPTEASFGGPSKKNPRPSNCISG